MSDYDSEAALTIQVALLTNTRDDYAYFGFIIQTENGWFGRLAKIRPRYNEYMEVKQLISDQYREKYGDAAADNANMLVSVLTAEEAGFFSVAHKLTDMIVSEDYGK